MSASAPPRVTVRCPNCGDVFAVRGAEHADREELVDVCADAMLEHFKKEHPGQSVGQGTTETAR